MDFFNEHMDYVLGSDYHSNAFFCYDFISIFFIGTQYMIHDEKPNMNLKKLQQKL